MNSANKSKKDAVSSAPSLEYGKEVSDDSNNTALMKEISERQIKLEEKQREIALLKSELDSYKLKLKKTYEHSPIGYFTLDPSGKILELNSAGAYLLGSTKELLFQKSFFDFVVPEHRDQLKLHLENTFKIEKGLTAEIKMERKDKSTFFALLESISFENEDHIICYTAVRDITNLKVAQEELKESEARFQNMANTAPVLIWITDADALFIFVNNYWLEFTGRTIGRELGMSWIEGIHPQDLTSFINIYNTAFAAKLPFDIEFRLKHKNGDFRWIKSKGIPRFHEDGRFFGFIGSGIDITEQKNIEEHIFVLNERLKSINASKDKFFSIIAHDLKSPLAGILGFTEVLSDEFDELSPEDIKEFIFHSHQSAKNLYVLLENLLEWSRIQIGSIAFNPLKINISQIFDEIIKLFSQNAKKKNIKLEKKCDPFQAVFADSNMLNTIIRNLLSNAIKFTKDGGTISLSAEELNNAVQITVQDSGVGISQENIDKLFKVENNFTSLGTNSEKGTGLGLVLCKELVEKHHGKIWVESELNTGTKFIFILPHTES
jgi:PAS domain S-box-containing protein